MTAGRPNQAHPVLLAVVRAALDATGAQSGWLLRARDDRFEVAAALGPEVHVNPVGRERGHRGAAGYVLASGQPAALQVKPGDADNAGAGNSGGSTPSSVLAAPCGDEDVVGVLELADAPGGRFSFDDVDTVVLLAEIAGAALAEWSSTPEPVPAPQELLASLVSLAERDSRGYADLARVLGTLL